MILGLLVFLTVMGAWIGALYYLDKKGILKKFNLQRWAIALMWKTEKGKNIIDILSKPKRFWLAISTVGTYFFFIAMVFMFLMLIMSAILSLTSPMVKPVKASEVLVLPGINPYVPFIYGILALIVAVVFHEFSHGILARVGGFKVRSLGLLFLIIPVGAFMEPDEKEVEKGPRLKRMRMYTAGPIMNFSLAAIFLLVFSWGFMSSVEADEDPLIITDISKGSPLYISLEEKIKAIYFVEDVPVHEPTDLHEKVGFEPGTWINITILVDKEIILYPTLAGLVITSITDGSPAAENGIEIGSVLMAIDNRTIHNGKELEDFLSEKKADEKILLELLKPSETNETNNVSVPDFIRDLDLEYKLDIPIFERVTYEIILADKGDWYRALFIDEHDGKGFVGIGTSYLGLNGVGSRSFIETLSRPVTSGDGIYDGILNMMYITFRLPLELNKMPFHSPLTDIYHITGVFSILPNGVFWFFANVVFYQFWLNMLLGIFNALPAVPLDGGAVFKDSIVSFLYNFTGTKGLKKSESIAKKISIFTSLTVLISLLLIFFGPYLKLLVQ